MKRTLLFVYFLFLFSLIPGIKAQNAGFAVLISGGGNQSNSQTLSDTAYQGKKSYRLEISSTFNTAYITYYKSIFALTRSGEKKVDSTFSISLYFRVSNAQVPLNVEMQLLNKKGNVASTAKESLRLSNTDWKKTTLTFSTKDSAITSIVFALSFPQGVSGTNALFIDDIWYKTNKDTLWWDDCDNLFTNMGPDPPRNISLKNGSRELPQQLKITWSPVLNAQGYYVKLMKDTTVVADEYVSSDTVYYTKLLEKGVTYQFSIATYTNLKGWYSLPIFFTVVVEMKEVTLVSPADNSLVPIRPTLIWRRLGNAVSYDVKAWNMTEEKIGFEKSGVTDTSLVADSLAYNTVYYWQVRERNILGEIGPWSSGFTFTTEKLVSVKEEIPYTFELSQNYPNPFNPTTSIKYEVSSITNVRLAVYDILGREVAILINEEKLPGRYEIKFDGTGLASGLYFYRITANSPVGGYSSIKKMLLLK